MPWVSQALLFCVREITNHLIVQDYQTFLSIYKECLEQGTLLRKEYGIYSYGENIDK